MPEKTIDLKNPILAGVLGFLIPGAGHFYQGRLFKAGIYSFCILGLFFSGMAMADWQAVKPPAKGDRSLLDKAKYVGQLGVGLPAMYGIIQRERYSSPGNRPPETISTPMTAPFTGAIFYQDINSQMQGELVGEVKLVPAKAAFGETTIAGSISGTVEGQPVFFQLNTRVNLDKPIKASSERNVDARILDEQQRDVGRISGSIPRPFLNWFQAPMENEEIQNLHRRLGKYHELAMVFTWVAGFLNVLAVWDAVEGPAYGYDDSHPVSDEQEPIPVPA